MDATARTDRTEGTDGRNAMYGNGEAHRRVRELREQARRLEADAERAADPGERSRLRQEAGRLESECEQESMMAAGDIYPTE